MLGGLSMNTKLFLEIQVMGDLRWLGKDGKMSAYPIFLTRARASPREFGICNFERD